MYVTDSLAQFRKVHEAYHFLSVAVFEEYDGQESVWIKNILVLN